jgi:glycopeptide antibiotics resistance protein
VLTSSGLWIFLLKPSTLAALASVLVAAWPVGRWFAARCRCSRAVAVTFILAVGVVLALTLTPNKPATGVYVLLVPQYLSLLKHDPAALWAQLVTLPTDDEQLANIALYVPVGLLGTFAWRSAPRAALFGLMLTVAVETCQYGIIGRAGSITDIRNNTTGALVGALLAATVRRRPLSTATAFRARSADPNTDIP